MREIPLTQGKVALIDDEDYDYVTQYKWYAVKAKGTYYACTHPKKKDAPIQMHRFIMRVNPFEKIQIDHRSRNGLDNQKHNLRKATHAQNCYNKTAKNGLVSAYIGVTFYKRTNKWRACINFNSKHIHIGYFLYEVDAALAYDNKAKELFGEFANLNFDGL